jgi:clan AA aspartic protease (TIGR02281 family)
VQEGHVVGWTFGPLLDRGVLWIGPEGGELEEDIRVDHFYQMTFARGREEQFVRAIAKAEHASDLERLEAFSRGFRLPPELPRDLTPAPLRKEAAAARMRGIAVALYEKGFSRDVSDILTTEVLFEAGDGELAVLSLAATAGYYGTADAVDRLEELLEGRGFDSDEAAARVREAGRELLLHWIREHVDRGDFSGARLALERALGLIPQHPELRLLSVEMALEDGDWRTALDLLQEVECPPELSNRASALANRAEGLRKEEGKVVIRFQPGLQNIPVNALLNGSVNQDFLIDTGASLVTIPSGTAEKLGLHLNREAPERWVSTAAGPVQAKEVVLDRIELQGKSLSGIRAFVLDIPGRPELGLLGLNFLKHFYVEMDSERGVLMLSPR